MKKVTARIISVVRNVARGFKLGAVLFFLLALPAVVHAAHYSPVLNIVPASTTPVSVSQSGTSLNYTVTNESTEAAHALIINPAYLINTSLVTAAVFNDNCTGHTLPSQGSTCTFSVSLISAGIPGSTLLEPQVCKSNGAVCSMPTVTNRVTLNTISGGSAPTITSISPTSGSSKGGTTVTITGTNLGSATSVTFGSVAATIVSNLTNSIVVRTGASSTLGVVSVVVTTPTGTVTDASAYTYNPVITTTAGANGSVTPSGFVVVAYNGSQTFTATPSTGYVVSTWVLDGTVAQTGGTSYTLSGVTANHTLTVSFMGSPASITATSGSGQTAVVSTAFTNPLVATVLDIHGQPVPGATVTFACVAVSGACATLSASTATTNSSGVASVTATANATVGGPYTVTATVAGASSPATFTLTNIAAPTITIVSGNNQSTVVGTAFSTALVVKVANGSGTALSGVTVTFTSPAGSSSVPGASFAGSTTTTAVTNSLGIATSTATLTANTKVGAFSVVASASSVTTGTATFTLTNTAGSPALISITNQDSQNQQASVADVSFPNPLGVTVTDQYGNPTANQTVTFLVVPVSGAGGTFLENGNTQIQLLTNSSGLITGQPTLVPNTVAGSYTVSASVGSAIPAIFRATNTVGTVTVSATDSTALTQSTAVGTAFAKSLSITVVDEFHNPVTPSYVKFTGLPTSGASCTLSANNIPTTAGVASATCTANTIASGTAYSVTATVYSDPANTEQIGSPVTFHLTNVVGTATSIVASGGGTQSVTVGGNPSTDLTALVTDTYGNVVPNVTVTFTAATLTGSANGTFSNGTNIITATTNSSGIATVDNTALTSNTSVGTYKVSATTTGASSPAVFNFTNVAGSTVLVITSGTSQNQTGIVNTLLSPGLSVTAQDANGNPKSGVSVTFTAPDSGTSGIFSNGSNAITVISGTNGVVAPPFTLNTLASSSSYVVAITGANSLSFTVTNQPKTTADLSVIVDGGNNQSAVAGASSFTDPLVAILKDQYGNTVPNTAVTFTAPSSGASGTFVSNGNTTYIVYTDSSGSASAAFAPNTVASSTSYTVTAAATNATSAVFSLTNTAGTPASMAINAGNSQSAAISQNFTTPLSVIIKDQYNNLVVGKAVTFTPPGSGTSGTFLGGNPGTATTNSAGVATAPTFTANTIAGSYTVTAATTSPSLSSLFTLTNSAGSAASIAISAGGTQSAIVGQPFTTNLTVLVTDASSNPVSGVTVTFAPPGSGASATLSSTTATTNSSGVASVVATANTTVGTYNVSASVSGVPTVVHFALTNSPDRTITVVSGSGQTATTSAAFTNPLTVKVVDTSSSPVSGVVVTFSVPTAGASATFAGGVVTATTDVNGLATTAVLTANSIGGTYSVTVSASRATTITSPTLTNQPFTITEPSLMYVKQASSGSVSYAGTVTLNNVSSGVITVPSFTDGFGTASTTCGATLSVGSSCTETRTLTGSGILPITLSSIIVDGTTSGYGTLTIPIAALSVRVLSPPQFPTNNAALMLVVGCTAMPEVIEVTNLSASAVAGIGYSAPTAAWSNSHNPTIVNNCSGLSLSAAASDVEGQSCTMSITPNASAASGEHGTITVTGTGGSGTLNPVTIIAAVEAANSASLPTVGALIPITYPSSTTETVIDTSSTCNLAKIAAGFDQASFDSYTDSPPPVAWDPSGASSLTTGGTSAFDGQTNTIKDVYTIYYLEDHLFSTFAAGLCEVLYENNDVSWYLPAVNLADIATSELGKTLVNTPGLINNNPYLSSTELDTVNETVVRALTLSTYTESKGDGQSARCIRAMTY